MQETIVRARCAQVILLAADRVQEREAIEDMPHASECSRVQQMANHF